MRKDVQDITHTLGARLMAIQAGLLVAKQPACRPEEMDRAFDKLLQGPDAQLLYSMWTREQRRDFQHYMLGLRKNIRLSA
jgi:hypothetical protein